MDKINFKGIKLFPLKKISNQLGHIYHAVKNDDEGFNNFGEAYFSIINQGMIKGWNKHKLMNLNLFVPHGEVKFVICNRVNKDNQKFFEIKLSPKNYFRLSIESGLWFAFKCISNYNSIILNVSDLKHNPSEMEKIDINKIPYNW